MVHLASQPPKIRLEMLLIKDGRTIGRICKAAKIAPRVLYELRKRCYLKPPRSKAIGKLAPVLGVSEGELLRMICANSPAAKLLPPSTEPEAQVS